MVCSETSIFINAFFYYFDIDFNIRFVYFRSKIITKKENKCMIVHRSPSHRVQIPLSHRNVVISRLSIDLIKTVRH